MKKATGRKSGIKIQGGMPQGRYPTPEPYPSNKSFNELIEERALDMKIKHPHNAASIVAKVSELKDRYERKELHDWYDTWEEFDRVATQSPLKSYVSGKKTGRK